MPESKRHPARRPQQRPSKPGHRNPAAAPAAPVPATGARATLERLSVGPLTFLSTLPSWLLPVLLAIVLVAGLALSSPWAGLLLLVPALFLAWLLALSWPVLSVTGKILRLTAVTALLAVMALKLLGKM